MACGFVAVGRVVVIVGVIMRVDMVTHGEETILVIKITVVGTEAGVELVYVPARAGEALCVVDIILALETEEPDGEAGTEAAGGSEVDGLVDVMAEA